MDYNVEEIQPNVWRVRIASITRIVRHRSDSRTFAPWDVTTADGQVLFSTESLESAFRWIQARTGYPAEALLAQALLETDANSEPSRGVEVSGESTQSDVSRDALGN
jgi:hypothetical protein